MLSCDPWARVCFDGDDGGGSGGGGDIGDAIGAAEAATMAASVAQGEDAAFGGMHTAAQAMSGGPGGVTSSDPTVQAFGQEFSPAVDPGNT